MNDVKKIANAELAGKRGNFDSSVSYPVIGFKGGATFGNEKQVSENYQLTLDNTGSAAVDQTVVICPAFYSAADVAEIKARIGVDSCLVIKDGDLNSTENAVVTCEGSPTPVKEFLHVVQSKAMRISHMILEPNNADQFREPLKVAKLKFTSTPVTSTITLNDKQDPSNNNDKLITVNLNHLQLDNDTIFYFKLKKARSMTITLYPGGMFDGNSYLDFAAKSEYNRLGVNREGK